METTTKIAAIDILLPLVGIMVTFPAFNALTMTGPGGQWQSLMYVSSDGTREWTARRSTVVDVTQQCVSYRRWHICSQAWRVTFAGGEC